MKEWADTHSPKNQTKFPAIRNFNHSYYNMAYQAGQVTIFKASEPAKWSKKCQLIRFGHALQTTMCCQDFNHCFTKPGSYLQILN